MLNFPELEKKILKFWQEKKIFEKLRKKNQGKERWSFLDGPITANNPMGVHHAWGRTYKDVFQRYKAMQGYDQRYQNGFDCQGLWVEVEVEKEMGFKTKKDIEKFGIEKFVEACKQRVKKYSKIQTEQSIRLGQWMDWENSYYTMSDENNYAIWGFLKKCWQEGFLYKGRDVVPWCIRCGTAISQHEILTEEYEEIIHKSVFVKLPVVGQPRTRASSVRGKKNNYFLVWTTTPWTLPANVSLAVSPKLIYAKVKDKKGDIFILLKNKADLIKGGEIIEEFTGDKLEGLKYKGMFDDLLAVKKELKKDDHRVILWKDVSEEEGTGIVHIAPGCGQEDFQLSKEFKLSIIDPLTEESRYKNGFGFLEGKLATEVGDLIFQDLEKKEFIFKIEDYQHRYPTCWRCKEELIFRLVDEWYIAMDLLRKPLVDVSKKIKWIPSFGLERELDWLKNMQDWLISKKRYWGLALPIFECQKCNSFEVIGSKEELKERAVSGWKEFAAPLKRGEPRPAILSGREGHTPHRPWVDEVKIKCLKCGQLVSRIPDVGNPWLDAGIVPFSTMGYYTDKDYWEKWFPADLVCESFPGQFKNWFYSIIVMSTVLEKTNPTKTIFGYALVRDEKGEEMHKSKENVIWFDEAVEKIGADPMRWMYTRQNPVFNLNFGYGPAEEIKRKLMTLWNSFTFFITYVDKKDFPKEELKPKSKPARQSPDGSRRLAGGNILNLWIISKLNNLIGKVSRNLDRYNPSTAILAIENFFIEDLSLWYIRRSRKRFHTTTNKKERKEAIEILYHVLLNLIKIIAPAVPFLAEEMYLELKNKSMPESVFLSDWPKMDKDLINKELEEKMKTVREIISHSLAQRAEAGIKVRQPLQQLTIDKKQLTKDFLELIKEEVNVKKIVFGKKIELDTKISPKLKEEGTVREIIRHIQQMRKIACYTTKDRISIQASGGSLDKILTRNKKLILKETRADKLEFGRRPKQVFAVEQEFKIDQQKLWLGIKKTK